MDFLPFPARLSAGYNGICEVGSARVAEREDAIDFTAEFVPLVPLGAPALVEWIQGETVVQPYEGQAYLSSPQMLRLVGVDGGLARQTRALFATNLSLPAVLRTAKEAPPMPARLEYLSLEVVTLAVPRAVKRGSRLLLAVEVDFLTLGNMPLQVETAVTLRRRESLLQCSLSPGSDENLIALNAYVPRLELL
jgi:hypothetical protein